MDVLILDYVFIITLDWHLLVIIIILFKRPACIIMRNEIENEGKYSYERR